MVAPAAPSDAERVLYVDPTGSRDAILRLVEAEPGASPVLAHSLWLLPFTEWIALGIAYFSRSFLAKTTRRRLTSPPTTALSRIGESEPNCGEPLAVLANAFAHVAKLEHAGGLRI